MSTSWSLIFLIVALSLTFASTKGKVASLSEISVILDDSLGVEDGEFEQMVKRVQQLPHNFSVNQNHSRIAVVRCAFNVTTNESAIRSLKLERQLGKTGMSKALKVVKEKVFAKTRPKAMKIIILVTPGFVLDINETERVTQQLRNDGCLVYISIVGERYKKYPHLVKHAENVAGDLSQIFDLGKSQDLIADIGRVSTLCEFSETCRFVDAARKRCAHDWYQPNKGNAPCEGATKPTSKGTLNCADVKDCHNICDRLRPWQTSWPCKSNDKGGTATTNRAGTTPSNHKAVLETCPRQKVVKCDEKVELTGATGPTPGKGVDKSGTATQPEKEGEDSPAWAIVAIVIGVLLALAAIAGAAYMGYRKMSHKQPTGKTASVGGSKKAPGDSIKSQPSGRPPSVAGGSMQSQPFGRSPSGRSAAVQASTLGQSQAKPSSMTGGPPTSKSAPRPKMGSDRSAAGSGRGPSSMKQQPTPKSQTSVRGQASAGAGSLKKPPAPRSIGLSKASLKMK